MSGVGVISYLLAADAGVTAQVPGTRIYGGVLPQTTALPAILVTQVSGVEMLTASMASLRRLRTSRVQVTVKAGTYPSTKTILDLVRTACRNRSGPVNGVDVDSILPDSEGPDIYDEDLKIFSQSRDFIVKWRTAA